MPKSIIFASLFLTIQIGVDAYMGDDAGYFNAWYVVLTFVELFTEGNGKQLNFIMGQAELGLIALPIALTILISLPLLFASVIDAARKMIAHHFQAKEL
ncbi:MAG: hypothetical protein V7708_18340 [Oceanicoccus sp.]